MYEDRKAAQARREIEDAEYEARRAQDDARRARARAEEALDYSRGNVEELRDASQELAGRVWDLERDLKILSDHVRNLEGMIRALTG